MIRWIGAITGFFLYRVPGALLGFLLGSVLSFIYKSAGSEQGGKRFAQASVSPSDFEIHLLSLCAIVIKADGHVSQTELDYVREYFVKAYGKEKANAVFRTFNEVIKNREILPERIASYLNQRTRYEVRLQLLHFLMGLAQADGEISVSEFSKLEELARYLHIGLRDYESIKAMFVRTVDHAYRILEIAPDASNEDIKKAYRTMVKKYHPDRVRTQDEAIRKGATAKFREVQQAYESLQKERGF